MIHCFIGTRAQLIKMAPVILEMENRKLPLTLYFTGQHEETLERLLKEFEISTPATLLYKSGEQSSILGVASWFFSLLIRLVKGKVFAVEKAKGLVLVHGDTLSALLGALAGRIRKIPVAHVESGLRSYNLFHPFPEEITRLLTFRLSNLCFCPGKWAYDNLAGYKVERVDTQHNTLLDSVRLALRHTSPEMTRFSGKAYGVCSIHRFENIFNKKRFEKILALLEKAAEQIPLVFVLHPATRKRLEMGNYLTRLSMNSKIEMIPRLTFVEFIHLSNQASLVITDGGSNQEELSYLGVPTLLMRKTTERQEGLGHTATLCAYDEQVLETFLQQVVHSRKQPSVILSSTVSPTKILVDTLARTLTQKN